MLNIYNATSYQCLVPGGYSSPWLVLADVNGHARPYIAKLYEGRESEVEVISDDFVGREIVGNVIAKQFNLKTPNQALIKFDQPFLDKVMLGRGMRSSFCNLRGGLAYGTEYLYPSLSYWPGSYTSREISKLVNIDTLYAFDFLIRNIDRGELRPNLLLHNNGLFLIDHEGGFQIDQQTFNEMLQGKNKANLSDHVFCNFLKATRPQVKRNYFSEFEDLLRKLDLELIDKYVRGLNEVGFRLDGFKIIMNYLESVKSNVPAFIKMLKTSIS